MATGYKMRRPSPVRARSPLGVSLGAVGVPAYGTGRVGYGARASFGGSGPTGAYGQLTTLGAMGALGGSSPTQAGMKTAGSAAGAGIAMVPGLVTAAAASGTVPVAGWIVAGGLVAAAGVVLLVDTFRKKGTKAARQLAIDQGYDLDFANEYAKLSVSKLAKAQDAQVKWRLKVVDQQEAVRKATRKLSEKNTNSRRKSLQNAKQKLGKFIDKLNAANIVVGLKTTVPEEPAVAGETQSIPVVAEERGVVGDALETAKSNPYAVAGAVAATLLLGVAVAYRSR